MFITTQGGSFTAGTTDKTLKIRSGIDWIKVLNYNEAAASNNGRGFEYYWQIGMGTTTIMKYHPAGDHTMAINTSANSIQIIDTSNYSIGANIAINGGGTTATQPVYTPASTAGLVAGNIVRINSTNHNNINGLDFSIDDIDNGGTNFRLANALATAPGRIAGNNGYYRLIAPNIEIYRMFTPNNRVIANITAANPAVVTTLVDHGYAIGQKVRFRIPSTDFGMTQMNNLVANITAVTDSTFTTDIDASAFTAFAFPTYDLAPFDYATVVPVGEGALYTDSKFYNQGYTGVVLKSGTTSPGGSNNDVIYWSAGIFETTSTD